MTPPTTIDRLMMLVDPVGKMIAALLAPCIVAGVAWVVNATGIDLPIDPPMIHTAIVSAFAAVVVWWRDNGNDPEAFARWAAKGVAAFVAPFVAALAAGVADQLGVDLPAGASYSDLLTFAVAGSVLVFVIRNNASATIPVAG